MKFQEMGARQNIYGHVRPNSATQMNEEVFQQWQAGQWQGITQPGVPKTPMQEAVESVSQRLALAQELVETLGSRLYPVLCDRPSVEAAPSSLELPDCQMTVTFLNVARMLNQINTKVRDYLDRLAL